MALTALLSDQKIDVRVAAARALGGSGHRLAHAALRRARPRSPRVRQAISEALAGSMLASRKPHPSQL